jgi:mannose-6-phosphate isomerase
VDATRIVRLEGVIRSYAWGSRTALPELLGRPATGEPQAELWLGAHPSAPARVAAGDGTSVALDAWIARDPGSVLGREAADRFGGELPFLLKVLAVDAPLSIQAHPDAAQARAGFARENAAGVPLDAPQRCYRDPHAKPELICALTPFLALDRFREPAEILRRIDALRVRALDEVIAPLRRSPDRRGLTAFFEAWMTLERGARAERLDAVVRAARAAEGDPALAEMARLAAAYPGDAGVLAPLFLHLVELAPGQALFLPAGELHAYLAGMAVEIMSSSDNVLRGGLTPKHVDVPELLRTLSFASGAVDVLAPRAQASGELRYETPAREFSLARIDVRPGRSFAAARARAVEILVCTAGAGRLEADPGLDFRRGDAFLVPASAAAYRVHGEAVLYRATVG